jgi:hypothetical protein
MHGGLPPTHGWPMPFSNSSSAAFSPGRISTPFSKSSARAHPTENKMKAIANKYLAISQSPFSIYLSSPNSNSCPIYTPLPE